jgi:tellurium resistance protein TerZ
VIELSAGQVLPLTTADGRPMDRVTIGVGWDHDPTAGAIASGRPDIDLDASAFQFTGDQLFDLAFFNNLSTRDGSVSHLGDNKTGRGEGDDETLTVELSRVYDRVDTIFLVVTSYQGHSLTWVNRAYCRLLDEEGEPIARFVITHGPPETGLVMAKLVRGDEHWLLHTVGEGIEAKVATEAVPALQPYL